MRDILLSFRITRRGRQSGPADQIIEEVDMRYIILFAALVLAAFVAAVQARAGTGEMARERAENAAAEIINMRSALAGEFIKPGIVITPETFKKVCGAVGARVKELTAGGLEVRHAAVRYRNPANAATAAEAEIIKRFEREDGLESVESELEREGRVWHSVTRPIYVERACLACHGDKESRPGFIVEKYPEDRAYGFKEGDLRGIITVAAPLD